MKKISTIVVMLLLFAAAGLAEFKKGINEVSTTTIDQVIRDRFEADSAADKAAIALKLNAADSIRLAEGANVTIGRGADHTYTIAAAASGGDLLYLPSEYYGWLNVIPVSGTADTAAWADSGYIAGGGIADGDFSRDKTNFVLNGGAVSCTTSSQWGGIHLNWATSRLDGFGNRDSTRYVDYFLVSIYITGSSYTNLPSTGIYFHFNDSTWASKKTLSYAQFVVPKAQLDSASWAHVKHARSALSVYGGYTIDNTRYVQSLIQAAPGGAVTWTFDGFMVVRADTVGTDTPCPFQRQNVDCSWIIEWRQQGDANCWIGQHYGKWLPLAPDGASASSLTRVMPEQTNPFLVR